MERNYRITLLLLLCVLAGWVPAQAQTFTDIAAGLDPVHHCTATWVDYDNDGDLDVFMLGQTLNLTYITRLYNNNGGAFTQVTGTGLPDLGANGATSRSSWGDFDNDGYVDVLIMGVTNFPTPILTNDLYRNNGGNGTFTLISVTPAGFPDVIRGTTTWGDYDNDGDLDVLVAGSGASSERVATVYRNDGPTLNPNEWAFTDIDPLYIPNPSFNYFTRVGTGAGGAWGDYDRDGDLDLVVMGYTLIGAYSKTTIYRNDGGLLVNANVTGVTDLALGHAAWGDYNNDGYLDLAIMGHLSATGFPSSKYLRVYRNNQDGTFTQVFNHYAGFTDGSATWGDGNNDGYLDLLVTGSASNWSTPETILFYGDGNAGFVPDPVSGLDDLYEGQAVWGDYDNDGKLDILLSGRATPSNSTTTKIFRSHTPLANTAPSRPATLTLVGSGFTSSSIALKWSSGSDAQTPAATLGYNLSIRETVSGKIVMAPMANTTTGYRRLPQLGNANHQKEWSIGGLKPETSYRACVQTIDQGFMPSDFRCITVTTAEPDEEPDMMIGDCASDVGAEPDLPCSPTYWNSPNIWIRHTNDALPYHQGVLFGQDNYVYVKLKNIGNNILPTGTVHIYFAKGNASAVWPKNWVGFYNNTSVLYGDYIGQARILDVYPNDEVVAEIRWPADRIPNPSDFNDDDANHFCILARFVATSDRMAYPDSPSTLDNTMYNNNIAWNNFAIVKPGEHGGGGRHVPIEIGNVMNNDNRVDLGFEVGKSLDGGDDHILNHAAIRVTLPDVLYDRWVAGGMQGEGIRKDDQGGKSFLVTDPHAAIRGLQFDADEQLTLDVEVTYHKPDPRDPRVFLWHVIQYEQGRELPIGGETLEIHMSNPDPSDTGK